MQKIVISRCCGGFGLSDEAIKLYAQLAKITLVTETDKYGYTNFYRDSISDDNYFSDREIARNDSLLVQVVETLGKDASSRYSKLAVVEVPDGVEWHISEYDGLEWVAENHRTWS
jgi:hypothetical protein